MRESPPNSITSLRHSLGDIVNQMSRLIAVYQISVQDSQVFSLVEGAQLCLVSHLDPGLAFGFGVG